MNTSHRPLMLATFRTDSTFEDIPIINLADARNPNPDVRRALADEIRDACINVGFFYVKNHGIPEETISSTVEAAKRFFALPSSTKMAMDIHKTPNFKGYTALLGENTNPENRGDLHEGFDIGWEEPTGTSRADDGAMTGENVWPDGLPGFREAVLEYYHAAVRLGQSLFPLFALALDLPEDFFDDKTTKPAAIMRLLYYPMQTGPVDDRVQGIGAHTDYECFTILWQQADVKALQVLNANGKWVDAVPIPGTLVVNLGDQFARWTNDVFKSTVHRAINRSGVERYSIPLFFGTDYDVKLEALPSCVSDDYPAQYEVVTAGEYVKSRLEATYAHSKVEH
ncbi:Clavaminate synthase-like protein [Lentinus tigrinus ALCF2SS1-7]|uniref:Clavaminate synthase-like protein n=1 Tax=Lentinus tigrinus ALCF2SS1-6 TaxID=1328759 RepID=A0A5C2RYH7_9APHY|nr:Clavaminate synthase-like protein [Lentinus tigrinus ALCF2SS1-6]RPD74006.1 Clavaminate synthase-like protein [Lentinus tigrinus ALCF2SS1-7]